MSTKIFTGFRFKQRNIREIHQDLVYLGKVVRQRTQGQINLLIHRCAVSVFDHRSVKKVAPFDAHPEGSPMSSARWWFMKSVREIRRTNLRDPLVDFDFEVVVFPLRTKFLGTYYCEQEDLVDLLSSQDWFEPYYYFDNADRPEEVTKKEWDQRRRDWDKALAYGDVPANVGFCLKLSDPLYHCSVTRFDRSLLPRLDARRKSLKLTDGVSKEDLKSLKKRLSKADLCEVSTCP